MGVSVGMDHEFDAAFNTLLVTLTNLIEDGMNNLVHALFTNGNDSFDHLLANSVIF